MKNINKIDLLYDQKKIKPGIEDIIPEFLKGVNKNIALNFVSYLNDIKMKPKWASANVWKVDLKKKAFCRIILPHCEHIFYNKKSSDKTSWKNSWIVSLYLRGREEYKNFNINNELIEFICNNVFYCLQCRNPCHGKKPGKDIIVFDKEIKNICWGRPLMWVYNPGKDEIEKIKKLFEYEFNLNGFTI